MVRWLSGGLVPFRMVVCSAKPGEPSSGRILASISWNFQEPTLPDEFHFWIFPDKICCKRFRKGETTWNHGKKPGNRLSNSSDLSQAPNIAPSAAPRSLRSLTWPLGCPGMPAKRIVNVGLDVPNRIYLNLWGLSMGYIYGIYGVYLCISMYIW